MALRILAYNSVDGKGRHVLHMHSHHPIGLPGSTQEDT